MRRNAGGAIAVVVLGDLARSPRMLNHARELAAVSPVLLIGYREHDFETPPGVRIIPLHPIARPTLNYGRLVYALVSALRLKLLFLELIGVLLRCRPVRLLAQNPPSLPVLAAARLLRIHVVLDWHNYGWTLLALRLGSSHWLVRLARSLEIRAARTASAHLCVSQAMRADLQQAGIPARVLYDRPLEIHPPSAPARDGKLVIVCPAGWTIDEDMGLLLDALTRLPTDLAQIHLTGDGPLRPSFAPRIRELRARGFEIHSGYLRESAYRALLRRAHLGISMHRSSSGLDLAMKVVDLFGDGVPVCALDYGPALREQVQPGENGYLFRTAAELAAILASPALERLRVVPAETWSQAWQRTAGPLLQDFTTP